MPPKVDGAITYGPWGGTGGSMFNDGTYTGIRQINLSRNVGIVSMKVCYDQDGKAVWGSKHGGTGGFRHDRVLYNQYKLHLSLELQTACLKYNKIKYSRNFCFFLAQFGR